MDAPKLNPQDSLKASFPKLNQGIENANEALKKSDAAVSISNNAVSTSNNAISISNEAKQTAEQVQSEFRQAVLEGDSSPLEGVLSVGADGTLYPDGPQQRLITEFSKLNNKLEQTANYVVAGSFDGDNGGERIQAALDSNFPFTTAHKIVVVDAMGVDENGVWLIKEQIKIPSNTTLLLNGSYLKLDSQVNNAMITNSDYENGNVNVHIEGNGAILDCNRENQDLTLNNYQNIGVHLYNVEGFRIKGITIKDAPRWSLVPEKCTNGVIDDIYFNNEGHINQDGVHILGPSSDIIVTKIRGIVGDDACVVNARLSSGGTNVFQGYGTGGDIERIIFDDIVISGGTHANTGILRTSGSPSTVIDTIILNNAIGYNLYEGILRLGGNDAIPIDNHRNIIVSNIVGYESEIGAISLVNMLRPVKNLQINNAKIFGKTRGIISNNGNAIDGLQLNNIYRFIKSSTGEIGSQGLFYFTQARIKGVQISNVQIEHENDSILDEALFNFNLAKVEDFMVRDIHSPCAKYYFNSQNPPSTTKNLRLDNVKINSGILDNWGFGDTWDCVINGYAKELGTGEYPQRSSYQTGDIVEFKSSNLSINNKYYIRNKIGGWDLISVFPKGIRLNITVGVIAANSFKVIFVPIENNLNTYFYQVKPNFELPNGCIFQVENKSEGITLTVVNASTGEVNISETTWLAIRTEGNFFQG